MEHLASTWYLFVLVGLVAGILSGALGVGSGIIVIPMLVLFFHLPQKTAQGTALALMTPMALFGAILYWKQGNMDVDPSTLFLLIAGALAGVIIGSGLVNRIPADLLRKIFAAFIVAIGIKMLLTPGAPRLSKETDNTEQRSTRHGPAKQ